MKKKEIYGNILKNVQTIKQSIMTELADELPFGITNDAALSELESLADINGIVMKELNKQGEDFLPVEGKPQFVAMEIDGERYLSHISKINATNSTPAREVAPAKVQSESVIPIPVPVEKPENKESGFSEPIPQNSPQADKKTDDFQMNETEKFDLPERDWATEYGVNEPEESPITDYSKQEDFVPESESQTTETVEETPTIEEEEKEEEIPAIPAPQIIGEITTPPTIASMQKAEIFTEEKEKKFDEFVYDVRRVMVSHMGSAPEEMQFFIAPLKIYKYSCPATPIVVSVYYRGRYYNFSSYDKIEDGRNMITIEINEYYLLVRGFFDEKGRFVSTINTTGISANQGDRINIVGEETHHPTGPNVGNGHLKFRYNGDEGEGIIEVFPRDAGKEEYLLVVRYGEFLDYPIIAKTPGGIQKYRLVNDGVNSELVCVWNGDVLSAEIVPV